MKRKTERRVEFAEIGKKKKRQAAAAQVASACQPLSFFPSFHSSALRLSITLSHCKRRRRLRFHCCCCCCCQKRYLFTGRRILFYLFRLARAAALVQVIQIEDMEILYAQTHNKLCG